jgi:arylsulfatase A
MFRKVFSVSIRPSVGLLSVALLVVLAACGGGKPEDSNAAVKKKPPNVIILFADDLGYGDLGSFGHPTIQTPNLDRLAQEGQKWTSFYTASSVCSPSRAALLTGRHAIRSGIAGVSVATQVFFPNSAGGLPQPELTIAEVLKQRGYATAAIGKWHLGHLPEYLPMSQGFDSYFGIPYSNDMDAPGGLQVPWTVELFHKEPNLNYWDVPLMDGTKILERPADQWTLTQRYTDRAVKFIEDNKEKPFFLYLAYAHPHTPVFASKEFWGKSVRGHYGDTVEEIDWSVGRIVETLKQLKLDENTMVIFSSDNGPWLLMDDLGGSAGLLRDGKGTTWEGGFRVPTVFWWPGRIAPKVVTEMGSTLDLLPTFADLVGVELPSDRVYDGSSLTGALLNGEGSPRKDMIFYRLQEIYAARIGSYKAHFITESSFGVGQKRMEHATPLLFNVDEDPSEKYDISSKHPEIIAKIRDLVAEHRSGVEPVEVMLSRYPPGERVGEEGIRPWIEK